MSISNKEGSIIKAFGTVLRDNIEINKLALTFKTIPKTTGKKVLPINFDGREVWREYLSPIKDQGNCGSCWANSSTSVLADRFALQSSNQVHVDLSAYAMVICESVISKAPTFDPNAASETNLEAHTSKSCARNTIFAALEFLYSYGTIGEECLQLRDLESHGLRSELQFRQVLDLPTCEQILGSGFDTCLDGKTAARWYRTLGGYNIVNDEMTIKEELFHYGPVISGFIIFTDFLSDYDGTTIYMGPTKDSKPQGGHAIRVVGWGEENGIKYWIIANSWSQDWGIGGFFKMKIGIKECQLENNFAACIPDILGLGIPGFEPTEDLKAVQDRYYFDIDERTGYSKDVVKKIKAGLLVGSLLPLVDEDLLPDFKSIYAANLPIHPPTYARQKLTEIKRGINLKISILILMIIGLIAAFLSHRYIIQKK